MLVNKFVQSIKQCKDCGSDYTQRQYNQYRCPKCQKEANRLMVRRASARYAVNNFKLEGLEVLKSDAIRSHREVGQLMGISHERVRQIENRAIQKLRSRAFEIAENMGIVA
jgi:transposase-like protein